MQVYAFEQGYTFGQMRTLRAWKLTVSPTWVNRYDNGHLISIGIEVPTELSRRAIQQRLANGTATEVSVQEYNHGACQCPPVPIGAPRNAPGSTSQPRRV